MAISKDQLVERGEDLLKKLSREHRNIRRAYKVKEIDSMGLIAKMIASRQVLNDRIATDVLVVSTEGPASSLSEYERDQRRKRLEEIKLFMHISTRMNDITNAMFEDARRGLDTHVLEMEQENDNLLYLAQQELDSVAGQINTLEKVIIEGTNGEEEDT